MERRTWKRSRQIRSPPWSRGQKPFQLQRRRTQRLASLPGLDDDHAASKWPSSQPGKCNTERWWWWSELFSALPPPDPEQIVRSPWIACRIQPVLRAVFATGTERCQSSLVPAKLSAQHRRSERPPTKYRGTANIDLWLAPTLPWYIPRARQRRGEILKALHS